MEDSSPKLILITGPKHSGKTTAGVFLAELLGAKFVDLDELVEGQTGKSPRSLFKEGPEIFRQAEARALAGIVSAALPGTAGHGQDGGAVWVVAAGGGLVDNAGALELLRGPEFSGNNTAIVYLEASADTAWERIRGAAQETGEWPAFLNVENPRETNAALHARRGAAYRELATLTVNGEGKSPEAIGREIALRLVPADSPKGTVRG
ncbi:MAG: AAA family ATPase [Treponema sp.]|jgi:shikimate kinase|nr:AAA family ATPase [Treponema sp.]